MTIWDCRTHVPKTSSVERTDLDFRISVALGGTHLTVENKNFGPAHYISKQPNLDLTMTECVIISVVSI